MVETIKLHLGAFDCSQAGWVNTDITPHFFVAKIPGLAALIGLPARWTLPDMTSIGRAYFERFGT